MRVLNLCACSPDLSPWWIHFCVLQKKYRRPGSVTQLKHCQKGVENILFSKIHQLVPRVSKCLQSGDNKGWYNSVNPAFHPMTAGTGSSPPWLWILKENRQHVLSCFNMTIFFSISFIFLCLHLVYLKHDKIWMTLDPRAESRKVAVWRQEFGSPG